MLAILSAFASRTDIEVDYLFRIRGHSYMFADRAFGRVEKRIRRHERILLPTRYIEEFRKEEKVLECFRDWPIIDLKSFAKDVLRSRQAFLISKQQRIQI